MDKDRKKNLKPSSYADYISVGPILVYRWLWLLLLFLFLCGVIAVTGVLPVMLSGEKDGEILAVDVGINAGDAPLFNREDSALADYTGLARIQDAEGVVRFAGDIKEGACTGKGIVFDTEGTPVYVGDLLDNQYDGEGRLLDKEAKVISEGEFIAGSFTGKGKQSAGNTLLPEKITKGEIPSGGSKQPIDGTAPQENTSNSDLPKTEDKQPIGETVDRTDTSNSDLPSGESKQPVDEILLREGTFKDGLLNGEGREYDKDGSMSLLREGVFANGKLSGVGTEYTADKETFEMITKVTDILKKGGGAAQPSFETDSTTGAQSGESRPEGTLQPESASATTGEINKKPEQASKVGVRLEGAFSNGKLEGAGRVYVDDALLYIGAFHEGKFQGEGTLQDPETGRIRYEGAFQEGLPSGKGELYDPVGQHYYSGTVYRGEIDVLSFLGTSLAFVESAFRIHPLIYAAEDKTAFVYPAQGLAFLTDSPVELIDPSAVTEEGAKNPNKEESGAGASEDASSIKGESDDGTSASQEAGDEESGEETDVAGDKAEAEKEKKVLSERTKPKEIQITGIIILGEGYPGLPKETDYLPDEETPVGGADYFAMEMLGTAADGYEKKQTGEYLTEFSAENVPPTAGEDNFSMDLPGETTGDYKQEQNGEQLTEISREKEKPKRQREIAVQGKLLVARCLINNGRYYLVSGYKP